MNNLAAMPDTNFKKTVARAYRDAIARMVNDELVGIIHSWIGVARGRAAQLLGMDDSNYAKWLKGYPQTWDWHVAVLVHLRKDFTDIHNGYSGREVDCPGANCSRSIRIKDVDPKQVVGAARAYALQLEGCRAALAAGLEIPECEVGTGEARALVELYARANPTGEADWNYDWIFTAREHRDQAAASRIQHVLGWNRSNGKKEDLISKLEQFLKKWGKVCVDVFGVLEGRGPADLALD